jgi:hypothetical protein
MNTFTTNLFRLLNAADTVIISGYTIESVQDVGTQDADGATVLRCEVDDDNEWHFVDQGVIVRNGVCTATTAAGDWTDEPTEVTLEFKVERMIDVSDLPPVSA